MKGIKKFKTLGYLKGRVIGFLNQKMNFQSIEDDMKFHSSFAES